MCYINSEMIAAFFQKLVEPIKELRAKGRVTTEDFKNALSAEKQVLRLFYPYVAERQAAIFALVWGAWLLAPWPEGYNLFGLRTFNVTQRFMTQHEAAGMSFFFGVVHCFGLYLHNHPIQGQLRFPRIMRRSCLFLETLLWAFLAATTFIGFPPSTAFISFLFFGFGAWVAFRDTGNKKTVQVVNTNLMSGSVVSSSRLEGLRN